MPTLFRKCSTAGCREIVKMPETKCARHKAISEKSHQQFIEARRLSSQERGYTSAWRRAREAFLREHPLCEQCRKEGRVTAAQCVDHIIPHKGNMDLFWDRSNWQALCNLCHSKKTAREDGGFGNKIKRG